MDSTFAPGFRISGLDAAILLAGVVGLVALSTTEPALVPVVAVPLLHFFMFCNVFRISRPLELVWAAVFVSLASATLVSGTPSWGVTILVSVLVGGSVIGVEMRKPSYHGVGWQRINPGLRQWWELQGSKLRAVATGNDSNSKPEKLEIRQ